jgi:hypothetical protein
MDTSKPCPDRLPGVCFQQFTSSCVWPLPSVTNPRAYIVIALLTFGRSIIRLQKYRLNYFQFLLLQLHCFAHSLVTKIS